MFDIIYFISITIFFVVCNFFAHKFIDGKNQELIKEIKTVNQKQAIITEKKITQSMI